jgi:Restriction endonuclease
MVTVGQSKGDGPIASGWLLDHSSLESGPILVECKHFALERPIGVGIVRAFYGVKVLNSASKAILATSSYVSKMPSENSPELFLGSLN